MLPLLLPFLAPQSGKEIRKIADRERKAAEKAAQAKAAALRDDDNVFDVSYENQGAEDVAASTLSATDIKVGGWGNGGGRAEGGGAMGRQMFPHLAWLAAALAGATLWQHGPPGRLRALPSSITVSQPLTSSAACGNPKPCVPAWPPPSSRQVHNLTIRAKGKVLLENTTLTIAAGRRYGLVGPNGKGKSTLLRMIARRQVPVPDSLDVLLVEQEIVGTEKSALEAVVAADVELLELREEEAEINRWEGCGLSPPPAPTCPASRRRGALHPPLPGGARLWEACRALRCSRSSAESHIPVSCSFPPPRLTGSWATWT